MKLRNLALGIALTFALASCENPVSSDDDEKTPTTPTTPDAPAKPDEPTSPAKPTPKPVFGGSYYEENRLIACYWQDGVRYGLGDSLTGSSNAMGMTASANGVTYVVGNYMESTAKPADAPRVTADPDEGESFPQPCYWANGTLVTLKGEDGTTALPNGGDTTGIAVANGTVFVSGWIGSELSMIAGYWKGTTFHTLELPEGAMYASAMSIAASTSGDAYVAGFYYVKDEATPCYWKNGGISDLALLPDAQEAYANSIALAGDDVYVCGRAVITTDPKNDLGTAQPCYWKNGACFALDGPNGDKSYPGDMAYARAICVLNGIVYTAGYYATDTNKVPCYWEGSTLHALAGGPTMDVFLSAIAVTDGTVSVAGYYRAQTETSGKTTRRIKTPCYWEGGAFHDLAADTPEGIIPFPESTVN